jgi:hypothetical protein
MSRRAFFGKACQKLARNVPNSSYFAGMGAQGPVPQGTAQARKSKVFLPKDRVSRVWAAQVWLDPRQSRQEFIEALRESISQKEILLIIFRCWHGHCNKGISERSGK